MLSCTHEYIIMSSIFLFYKVYSRVNVPFYPLLFIYYVFFFEYPPFEMYVYYIMRSVYILQLS